MNRWGKRRKREEGAIQKNQKDIDPRKKGKEVEAEKEREREV